MLALEQNMHIDNSTIFPQLRNFRDESLLRTVLALCSVRYVQMMNFERILFPYIAKDIGHQWLAGIGDILMGDDLSSLFYTTTACEGEPELIGVRIDDVW